MIVLLKCFRIDGTALPLADASEGHCYSEMINETRIRCWHGSSQFTHEIGAM
jgi:hypothetical protein